jgi:hypothetical protein
MTPKIGSKFIVVLADILLKRKAPIKAKIIAGIPKFRNKCQLIDLAVSATFKILLLR